MFCLLMVPAICSANFGTPAIIFSYPAMLASLFVIVPLEAFVIKNFFDRDKSLVAGYRKILGVSLRANIITSAIGFPVAWLFLLLIQYILMVLMYELLKPFIYPYILYLVGWAWLFPGLPGSENTVITIAFIINLVVAFFLSISWETVIFAKALKGAEIIKIKKAILKANLISYAFNDCCKYLLSLFGEICDRFNV